MIRSIRSNPVFEEARRPLAHRLRRHNRAGLGARLRTGSVVASLLVAVPFTMVACGPALESMHESNIRFEHCYRLDMDLQIAPSHREHCWRDWLRTYAYGQPRDRIEYARRRIITLESGDTRRVTIYTSPEPRKRVFAEMGGEPESAPAAAPAPTSAHAPPPSVAPQAAPRKPEAKAEPSSEPGEPLPGEGCGAACQKSYDECQKGCDSEMGCPPCREDYRECMRRCFE